MSIELILNRLPNKFAPEASLRVAFVGMTLVIICVAWLAIAYSQRRLGEMHHAMTDHHALLGQHTRLVAQSSKLQHQIEETTRDCDLLLAKLPTSPSETEFLTLLSESAHQFNVVMGDYRPGSVQAGPVANQIELRLRASGTYYGLCQWLDNIPRLPRIVNLTHLTFTGPTVSGGDCTVDLQFMLVFGFEPGDR